MKGNNVALAVLVAVDDSTYADFKGHAAVTDSVVVQTATETGSMHYAKKGELNFKLPRRAFD